MPRGSAWVRKILQRLERKIGARKPPGDVDPFRMMILSILSHRVKSRRASRVLARLERGFVDWNEVRVSTLGEIEAAIQEVDPFKNKALVLRRALEEVFRRTHALDMEFFLEFRPRQAREFLGPIEGLDSKTRSDLLALVEKSYSIPSDEDFLRVCMRVGLVSDDLSAGEAAKVLSRLVPKTLAYEFTQLVTEHGRTHCVERGFDCSACVLREICMTGRAKGSRRSSSCSPALRAKRSGR